MKLTSNKQNMNFNSTSQIKDKTLNYKGYFHGKEDEADSHNHEFGGHFKIKDLCKRLEKVQKDQKAFQEMEQMFNKVKA